MLDFEAAWADQEDFESLVAPREPPGLELYPYTEKYGFGIILRTWSGYPPQKPIAALIPHGVYLGLGKTPAGQETETELRVALSYPAYADATWRRADMVAIPVASPFLYAMEIMRRDGVLREDVERSGTLFFPAHSTDLIRMSADMDATVQMLEDLPDEMKPVTVCAFWHDYVTGAHKEFENRGFKLVCAGHHSNQAFMIRLIHLMTPFRYAIVDKLGSSMFYATAAGLDVSLKDGSVESKTHPEFQAVERNEDGESRMEHVRGVFTQGTSEQKREMTDYMLRRDALRTEDGLLSDLLYAEKLFIARPGRPPRMR